MESAESVICFKCAVKRLLIQFKRDMKENPSLFFEYQDADRDD